MTNTLTNFLTNFHPPSMGEVRALGYLAITQGDLERAKLIAAKERVLIGKQDWDAAVGYAKARGCSVDEPTRQDIEEFYREQVEV